MRFETWGTVKRSKFEASAASTSSHNDGSVAASLLRFSGRVTIAGSLQSSD